MRVNFTVPPRLSARSETTSPASSTQIICMQKNAWKTNFNFYWKPRPRVPRAAASLWELSPHAFSLDVIRHPHKTPDQYSPVTRSLGTQHPINAWEQPVKHKRPLKTFNNHLRKLTRPVRLILRISIDWKKGLWLLFDTPRWWFLEFVLCPVKKIVKVWS